MAYNVSSWKTKELEALVIPIASLFKCDREDWHPERLDKPDGYCVFTIMESEIEGVTDGDFLHVTKISIHGEGSGTALHWVIEPALQDSTGKLVATRIWEGGDSVDRLTVIDGQLRSEDVDF